MLIGFWWPVNEQFLAKGVYAKPSVCVCHLVYELYISFQFPRRTTIKNVKHAKYRAGGFAAAKNDQTTVK